MALYTWASSREKGRFLFFPSVYYAVKKPLSKEDRLDLEGLRIRPLYAVQYENTGAVRQLAKVKARSASNIAVLFVGYITLITESEKAF